VIFGNWSSIARGSNLNKNFVRHGGDDKNAEEEKLLKEEREAEHGCVCGNGHHKSQHRFIIGDRSAGVSRSVDELFLYDFIKWEWFSHEFASVTHLWRVWLLTERFHSI
jgi:hypothetical protein